MQELIDSIKNAAGISEQQAAAAAEAAQTFIKGKVPPMFSGLVDQIFSGKLDPSAAMKAAQQRQSEFMDKAKDVMGQAADRSADYARQAGDHVQEWARQAGGWSEEAFEKFKSMFGNSSNQASNK
ncbi:MAG: hypothetical protein JST06_03485 [Bacteroidetes bacterium]|nr:hypothetical protein [Bacteroidota bacterium]MBS1630555.1 hypothetical protein [Bacteroidota bacterium]